jgi:hypothetical protein
MSKKDRKKNQKSEISVDGWALYNEMTKEYSFMTELPDTLTTGSEYDLGKATLIIHHNH